MSRKGYYRLFVSFVLLMTMMYLYDKSSIEVADSLPETIYMESFSDVSIDSFFPISAEFENVETAVNNELVIKSDKSGTYKMRYNLLGVIPVKEATINVIGRKRLYPMGMPIGMYLHTNGIMVIGTGDFKDSKGEIVKM